MLYLLAEITPTVIQIDWQSASIVGGGIGTAILAAAKMLVEQLKANVAATNQRHNDNRADAERFRSESRIDTAEARKENRELSGAILNISSQQVRSLSELQAEIRAVLNKLAEFDPGSKTHTINKTKG